MAAAMSLPALVMAADQAGAGERQKKTAPTMTMDVRELNLNIAKYAGKQVSVSGEIDDKVGPRSFILESGGVFDDEIIVILPTNVQGLKPEQLREDANIVVTGTVRPMTVVEVERELNWDLTPEVEVEFEGIQNYLVADKIALQ